MTQRLHEKNNRKTYIKSIERVSCGIVGVSVHPQLTINHGFKRQAMRY